MFSGNIYYNKTVRGRGGTPACRQAGVYAQDSMYYVYVIKSIVVGSYYKGRTIDIDRRLKEHESGKTLSIRIKKPFRLIHVEIVDTLEQARKLETYFKSGFGRENIKEIDADVAELVYAQS